MVTKIHANVAADVSSGWEGVMDKDPKGRGSDPLSFGDLNLNDIVILYGWGHR